MNEFKQIGFNGLVGLLVMNAAIIKLFCIIFNSFVHCHFRIVIVKSSFDLSPLNDKSSKLPVVVGA